MPEAWQRTAFARWPRALGWCRLQLGAALQILGVKHSQRGLHVQPLVAWPVYSVALSLLLSLLSILLERFKGY